MGVLDRFDLGIRALFQLGPRPVGRNALYRAGLSLGYWKARTPAPIPEETGPLVFPLSFPGSAPLKEIAGKMGLTDLEQAAGELLRGYARLFGGPAVPLEFAAQGTLAHWTEYERGRAGWGVEDVKLLWEGARFGWAIAAGRAYRLTGDERLVQAFWERTEQFLSVNPPYLGPQWVSAQEAAIRLIS